MKYDACDTVIPATDTIVESQNGTTISSIPDRSKMYQGQTPQSFRAKKLRDVFNALTEEEKLLQAMNYPCPISKYNGKTLGEVLTLDPAAIKWVATKYAGNDEAKVAANRICEHALAVTEKE